MVASETATVPSSLPDAGTESDVPEVLEFPCSLSQERFWVLDRLAPDSSALNVAVRWRLVGKVDATVLETAIRLTVTRHELLRTSFFEVAGVPRQRVADDVVVPLVVHDLTALPESERDAAVIRLGSAEARKPFQLDAPPLLRTTLLRTAAEEALLLVTAHHMVCDGWSVGVLARDIGRSYRALRAGESGTLPELPIQYGDYAEWQRSWLASGGAEPARSYWSRALAGYRRFELPLDWPRPPVQTTNGAIASLLLPRTLSDRAEAFGRERGATFFTTALTALAIMLHRCTNEADIALGTQVAGRDQLELEDMVGLFINTLVLRVDASGDPTVAALLDRVKTMVADALAYAAMPFEQLIEMLRPARDLSRSALFSINFIFQRSFIRNESYGEYALVDMPSHAAGALYDINFFMVERPEGWRASCEYNTDLFLPGTIDALLQAWRTILGGLAEHSGTTIGRMPLLDEAARARIDQWQGVAAAYPAQPVARLIAEQAVRIPDATAVTGGDQTLSYRALLAAADRVAANLALHGVGPGTLVAICLERSCEAAVALMGVLRAGAAYLTLDPAATAASLAQCVRDAAPTLVLTTRSVRALLPTDVPTLTLAEANEDAAVAPSPPDPSPDDLAWIVFTPDAGGAAKGVRISHRALGNLIGALRHRPGLGSQDTMLAIAPFGSGLAAIEILLPLVAGARVAFASAAAAADPVLLRQALTTVGATHMQATPALWQALLDSGWSGRLTMLCGGETLPRPLATQLLRRGSLWQVYGFPEATFWSAAGLVADGVGPVPVGPPIPNTQFHLFSPMLEPVPVGGVGELFIGGDGVALGYHNRLGETRERFIDDPARPGHRLYRTGTMARRRADGLLDIIAEREATPRQASAPPRASPAPLAVATQESVLARLTRIWRDVLGVNEVTPDSNFFDLGGHSLLATRMLARVEKEFGHRPSLAALFSAPTVRGVVALLAPTAPAPNDELEIVTLQPKGDGIPVIALNNSGVFYPVARALQESRPFTAVSLVDPDRARPLPETGFEDIAAQYTEQVRRLQPHGPYILMGWCMAGNLAFEVAQHLTAAGEEVRLIVMVDTWAPGYLKRLPPVRRFLADLAYRWQWQLTELRAGGDRTTRVLFNNRYARRLGLLRLGRMLPVLRQHLEDDPFGWHVGYLARHAAHYTPSTYKGAVLLFHNLEQPDGRLLSPDLGWRDVLTGPFKVAGVPGGHRTVFHPPGASIMAAHITAFLDEIGDRTGTADGG